MLWQKRSSAPADGQSGAPDLKSIAGLPGRLLFGDGFAGGRMTDIPCTVRKVDRSEILVELLHAGSAPQPESAVILEVANQTALIQCFTTVRSRAKGSELALRTPARPHVMQRRRFPRIDVFLGVTIYTADRSINPFAAQMTNLSIDGAACVLAEPLAPGQAVRINLTVVGLHPPEVEAVVVRCTATPSHLWVIGFQFRGMKPAQEASVAKYISDCLESQTQV
jgi:hypothetical protein